MHIRMMALVLLTFTAMAAVHAQKQDSIRFRFQTDSTGYYSSEA